MIIATCLVMAGVTQTFITPKVVKVACVGDSITERSGYPAKLQILLGGRYKVENFGVSGSTVSVNSNISYMNQTAFQKALDFEPDIVLIMLGTNDANRATCYDTDISDDYMRLVTSFQNLQSSPEIVAIDSPPIYSNYSGYNNTYLAANVIPQINTVAGEMNLPTVDMYDTMNSSGYFADGIHPNDNGSTVLADTLCGAVQQYYDPTNDPYT
jgi:Lysophospholipase L1 and related esterases